jgi:hypothetical protein
MSLIAIKVPVETPCFSAMASQVSPLTTLYLTPDRQRAVAAAVYPRTANPPGWVMLVARVGTAVGYDSEHVL